MKSLLPLALIVACAARASADYASDLAALAADPTLNDSQRLNRLFDIDWDHTMHEFPEYATAVGYAGQDGRWTDVSQAAIDRRKGEGTLQLNVLKAVDRAKLSQPDQLNYDLYRRDVELGIEGNKFPGEFLAINQLGGVQQDVASTLESMPRASVKNYEDMLSRLRGVPVLIDQNIDLLKRGVEIGVTPPKITLGEVSNQIDALLTADPIKSPLLVPFTDFPQSIPQADQERLRGEAIKIFNEQVKPAYQKLKDYWVKEYFPKTRDSVGCSALPDGEAWYAYLVKERTTTQMTPKEIHELGLSEVKRIRAEMDKIIADLKFKGSFQDFVKYLRTDPKFFYTSKEDLLTGYRDIAKRIDPELPRLFGKLPRLTYGVKPVPEYSEKSASAAYYQPGSDKAGRPGWFYANTYDLPGRAKWQMECLTLHEAVPGHHLQISLAQEMGDVPEFRKNDSYTAFVEGWGLYAESLGGELGMYKDPYSKFGALSFELWRAVRLVVDTGVHSMGWTRDQALAYMNDNSANAPHDNAVEIDRYIVWPGQALAYKIGQLKIRELRDYARRELGDSFDIRAFHDTVLANGALPLDTLESVIKDWVQVQKTKKAS